MTDRRIEDEQFAREAADLIRRRGETMQKRAAEDLAVMEAAHAESLALLKDAEELYDIQFSRADGLRGILYRRLGYRGKRPPLLVQLDDLERQARDAKAGAAEANKKAGRLLGWSRQLLIRP